MVKDIIINSLKTVTRSEDIKLDIPSDPNHGEYATNVALAESKRQGRPPRELAEELVSKLNEDNELKKIVSKIEIAGPGFINFFLSGNAFTDTINSVLDKAEKYGTSEEYNGKKVVVEFTDPNPFKEFHIGHLYSNIVGESISRLFESQGADVRRACYQGDVGMHVAKSLWGLRKKMDEEHVSVEDLEQKDIVSRVRYMGQAYALGATAFEESDEAKEEIKALNKKVFEKDAEVYGLYHKGRQWSLDYFETIYKRLGTKFDFYYFESEVGVDGKELVLEYLKRGIFEKSDGAVVFPGEKYGLHTRVFINSLGLPTYEAKELGLAPRKYKDFPYDLSIIITGNEINEYFKVLMKALEIINPELSSKTVHLGHGMVRLPEGKMSSRTGKIIAGDDLLDDVAEELKKLNPDNTDVIDQVAVGAVKGSFLQVGVGQDIIFDIGKSISVEGNSGPYLQYTYARANSVISKANHEVLQKTTVSEAFDDKEKSVARAIIYYPEIVKSAAKNYSPHVLVNYLFDLSSEFNSFYNSERILDSDRKNERVLLTKAVGIVIKNGLNLLGIEAPSKM